MAQVAQIREVLQMIEARGGGNEWLSAEHDVIYLPTFESKDDPEAERLTALGCHWDGAAGSWAMFT